MLDRQDLGIPGGLADQLDHRGETVVRVISDYILLPHHRKKVRLSAEGRWDGGQKWFELEVGTIDGGQLHQVGQTDWTLDGEHLIRGQPQVLDQHRSDPLGHRVIDFQAIGRAEPAQAHSLFDGHREIRCLVLLDLEVGVPGEPKRIGGQYFDTGEEQIEIGGYHCLDPDVSVGRLYEPEALVAVGALLAWNLEQAREGGRHFEPGEAFSLDGVVDQHGQVHAQVCDVGERSARIEGQGSEGREDLTLEMAAQEFHLLALEFLVAQHGQIGFAQGFAQVRLPAIHLSAQLRKKFSADGRQLFGRCHAVGWRGQHARFQLTPQAGHPDHEEFVEVVGEDRQELDALEKRMPVVESLLQYPAVELHPANLAVGEQRGVVEIGDHWRFGMLCSGHHD